MRACVFEMGGKMGRIITLLCEKQQYVVSIRTRSRSAAEPQRVREGRSPCSQGDFSHGVNDCVVTAL